MVMGFLGKKNKGTDEESQRLEIMTHQIMDLKDQFKILAEQQSKMDKDRNDIHQALNILDEDISDIKDSFGKGSLGNQIKGNAAVVDKGLEQRLVRVEKVVNDLKLIGRLAVENRDEIDSIMKILRKISGPEFGGVFMKHDSEADRFKRIENEIEDLRGKDVIVEGAGSKRS